MTIHFSKVVVTQVKLVTAMSSRSNHYGNKFRKGAINSTSPIRSLRGRTHAEFAFAARQVKQQVDVQSAEQLLMFRECPRRGEPPQGVAEAVVSLLDPTLLVQRHAIVVQLVQQGEPDR